MSVIKNPKTLSDIQDEIFANKSFWPKEEDSDEITYCNVATNAVLTAVGYGELQGMLADGMYQFVSTSKDWLIKPMADAQALVNVGTILLAILPAVKLGQSHGHVNTLTPGQEDFSGHWNCKTPLCLNLGRKGTCFRAKGENYAFQPIPEIYALMETL